MISIIYFPTNCHQFICAIFLYRATSKCGELGRVSHLEGTTLNADVVDATKLRTKSLFIMLYKYSLTHDIVEKDYAQVMFANGNPVKRENKSDKVPFTDDEIRLLWQNLDSIPFTDMILIEIYIGWRPQELTILKSTDIDIAAGTMKDGLKIAAGKNRIVPIHSLIKPLIENCKMLYPILRYCFLIVCIV